MDKIGLLFLMGISFLFSIVYMLFINTHTSEKYIQTQRIYHNCKGCCIVTQGILNLSDYKK